MFETLFGAEMPLAVRFFLAFGIVLGLIGAAAWVVQRRFGSAAAPGSLQMKSAGGAGGFFKVLFWAHQVVLGLPSVNVGLDLLSEGKTQGIINAIGLLLAWIGGTLVWGLAAIMHQRSVYELPPVFAAINENVARLETMQTHARAVSAVADAVEPRTE